MRLKHQEHVDEIRARKEVACQKAKEPKADLVLAWKQREHLRKKEAEIELGKQDANRKIRITKVCIIIVYHHIVDIPPHGLGQDMELVMPTTSLLNVAEASQPNQTAKEEA